jgi:hypothetical protein
MGTLVSTTLGILLGGLITWIASRHYYLRSSKELEAEAARVRKLTTLVLRALEEKGLARLNRDAQGEIIGLVLDVTAPFKGTGSLGISLEQEKGGAPQ